MINQNPSKYDPELWPYAPGNAPAEIEEALQREAARWPEPTVELRDHVTAAFRRVDARVQPNDVKRETGPRRAQARAADTDRAPRLQ